MVKTVWINLPAHYGISQPLRILNSVRAPLSLLVLLSGLLVFSQQVHSEEPILPLRYNLGSTSAWIPYGYSGDPEKQGICADLVRAIMHYAKLPYEFYYYPPKRAEMAMKSGKLDFDFMSPEWLKNGNIGEDFVSTVAIFELVEYIVTLPENAEHFSRPDAIYDQRIGTVAGYSYHDDDKFTRVDFLSENKLIEGLTKQRFDAVILEGVTARYWASTHQVDISLASVHSHGEIVIRLRKEHQQLISVLNNAITSLQRNGQIKKIFERYNVH